jgi:hypothetical protein
MDLNKMMNDALAQMKEENFVEGVVRKRLEKTITEIVDDVFRGYGDFGKKLKEYIEENLNINFEKLGLEGYNGLVLAAVKEQLDKTITVQGIEKIKETMDKILKEVKQEYTLSEIIEKLKSESLKEEYEFDYDEKIELKIEDGGSGYKRIYLDEEEKDYKHDFDYQIAIDNEGKPYSIKLKGNEINTKKIMGGLYGLEALLFKIYASGSKIVLDNGNDPEDYELYYRQDD